MVACAPPCAAANVRASLKVIWDPSYQKASLHPPKALSGTPSTAFPGARQTNALHLHSYLKGACSACLTCCAINTHTHMQTQKHSCIHKHSLSLVPINMGAAHQHACSASSSAMSLARVAGGRRTGPVPFVASRPSLRACAAAGLRTRRPESDVRYLHRHSAIAHAHVCVLCVCVMCVRVCVCVCVRVRARA